MTEELLLAVGCWLPAQPPIRELRTTIAFSTNGLGRWSQTTETNGDLHDRWYAQRLGEEREMCAFPPRYHANVATAYNRQTFIAHASMS